MRNFTLACMSLLCFIGVLFTTSAQTQRPAEQQNQDRIVISKDEVLFDLVVRDKKGKMIKDLAQQDFEIYEDGVKQDINSFRFVSSTVAETASPATNKPQLRCSNSDKDSGRSDAGIIGCQCCCTRLRSTLTRIAATCTRCCAELPR